jgi:hypothetical protein
MRTGFLPVMLAIAAVLSAALVAAPGDALAQSGARAKAKAKVTEPPDTDGWRFVREPGVPTLQYTPRGGQQVQLSFACHPDTALVRVVTSIGSRGVRPGDSAAIRLTAGRNRFEIAGTAYAADDSGRVDIAGATRIDERLFELFTVADTLRLELPGRRRSLPIAKIAPVAEAFEKACLEKR